MFYDVFLTLCVQKNVTASRAAGDIGLSRAAVQKWKNGAIPKGSILNSLAEYFGVTVDYLLGNEEEKSPSSKELDRQLEGIEFALFGEVHELTDAEKEDVLAFIKFKKSLRKD